MRAYGPAVLRLCVGTILAAHGTEQLFGVWGGGGLAATTALIASFGGKPAHALALASAAGELAAGALLIAGAFTRWAALLLVVVRAFAAYEAYVVTRLYATADLTVRAGFELSLLMIGALVSLAITGPGALSMDERKARSAERAAAGRARLRSR